MMSEMFLFEEMKKDLDDEIKMLSERRTKRIAVLSLQLPEEVRNFTTGCRIMMLREKAKELPREEGFRLKNQLDSIDEMGKTIEAMLDLRNTVTKLLAEF